MIGVMRKMPENTPALKLFTIKSRKKAFSVNMLMLYVFTVDRISIARMNKILQIDNHAFTIVLLSVPKSIKPFWMLCMNGDDLLGL